MKLAKSATIAINLHCRTTRYYNKTETKIFQNYLNNIVSIIFRMEYTTQAGLFIYMKFYSGSYKNTIPVPRKENKQKYKCVSGSDRME